MKANAMNAANAGIPNDARQAPVVSVLMLCYNRPQFMRQGIESVLAQTYTDFEFVIVDNGSQDEAVFATAQEFAERDARIVLHREPKNLGISGGRQRVLELTRGRYIATLEDDDYWHAEKLQKQVSFMQAHPSVGLCSCSNILVDADGREIGRNMLSSHISPQTTDTASIGSGYSAGKLNGSGLIVRRDLFLQCGGYRSFFLADDSDLFYRMQEVGDTATQSDCLIYYRLWQGNACGELIMRLYEIAAEISACYRRMGLLDPVTQWPDLDSLIIRYFHPCDYGRGNEKWRSERRIARGFLRMGKYAELRRFLRARLPRAKPHIMRLYVSIALWTFKYKRFAFWTGAASKKPS